MRTAYLYVDGESHYAMAEKCLRNIHGEEAMLETVVVNPTSGAPTYADQRFWHNRDARFFWDKHVTYLANISFAHIDRSVYFTAFTGTPKNLHKARVSIREAGFEPQVLLEVKDLLQQRANRLVSDGVLIKAKGVDIALAVRMLEDAYYGNYQVCLLFTSDIDYLPVIHAVRRMGKTVIVFGFNEGIAVDSPFLYVAERYIDIGVAYMQRHYAIKTE